MSTIPIPDGTVRSTDLAESAGITYRMLDYWVRCGYIAAESGKTHLQERDGKHPGSGAVRIFSATEARVCCLMGSLIRAGFLAAPTATVARDVIESDDGTVELADGLILVCLDDVQPPPEVIENVCLVGDFL